MSSGNTKCLQDLLWLRGRFPHEQRLHEFLTALAAQVAPNPGPPIDDIERLIARLHGQGDERAMRCAGHLRALLDPTDTGDDPAEIFVFGHARDPHGQDPKRFPWLIVEPGNPEPREIVTKTSGVTALHIAALWAGASVDGRAFVVPHAKAIDNALRGQLNRGRDELAKLGAERLAEVLRVKVTDGGMAYTGDACIIAEPDPILRQVMVPSTRKLPPLRDRAKPVGCKQDREQDHETAACKAEALARSWDRERDLEAVIDGQMVGASEAGKHQKVSGLRFGTIGRCACGALGRRNACCGNPVCGDCRNQVCCNATARKPEPCSPMVKHVGGTDQVARARDWKGDTDKKLLADAAKLESVYRGPPEETRFLSDAERAEVAAWLEVVRGTAA